jgi:SAM-dependent methyltransferase
MEHDHRFASERFPRSAKYHPDWILAGASGGANPLWLTEWLTEGMDLRPGMKVLDLGCGRALSSIFLHRELGVQVWATDLWFSATENLHRVRDAGVAEGVFPIHADARALPFAAEFFDAIVSVDSFPYYGTDDRYLGLLLRLLKPGGQLGMAGAGLVQEMEGPVPEHLRDWWTPDMGCMHSPGWWRRHWERSGLVDPEVADVLPGGWRFWRDWHVAVAPENQAEIQALEADQGRHLGYLRVIARRREVPIEEPLMSIPLRYAKHRMLREADPDSSRPSSG